MDLIVTNAQGKAVGSYTDYTLDLAFGDSENDFELTIPGVRLEKDCRIMIDGTEYGGIVDQVKTSTRNNASTLTYTGRTWHGLLGQKILQPDAGKDYLTMSGVLSNVVNDIITRTNLGGQNPFTGCPAPPVGPTISNYQFDRYVDAYSAIRKMLKANGYRLTMSATDTTIQLGIGPVVTYGDTVDSDLLDFDATTSGNTINHLVCLGEGELKNRVITHWYADKDGNVSKTQSLTGVNERMAVYDYSNAKADELETEGQKKLTELQNQSEIKISVHDDLDAHIGDVVVGRDNNTGITASAEIVKKIVKVSKGVMTVDYEVGSSTAQSSSLSGTAESTPGGHAYYAGDGLKLTDWTFSAEVSSATIAGMQSTVTQAGKDASNAQETAAGVRQDIDNASLTIGTVTTGLPGGGAAASLSGSGLSHTLNLTIPQGAKGDTGDAATIDTVSASVDANVGTPTVTVTRSGTAQHRSYSLAFHNLKGERGLPGQIDGDTGQSIMFLAAHPIGGLYWTTSPDDPAVANPGSSWVELACMLGGHIWQRLT